MGTNCPIAVPDDPARLSELPFTRPANIDAWGGVEYLASLKQTHKWQFSPKNETIDGWKSAIYSSQFRANCDRFLLVEDDLTKAGLGFTAKLWTTALMVAMRDNRVLVEVRMVKMGNKTRSDGFERPRWCDRPPYTLQCLYQTWTHCPLPGPNATEIRPGGRPLNMKRWPHDANIIRTGLGRIHRQGTFWYGARVADERGSSFSLPTTTMGDEHRRLCDARCGPCATQFCQHSHSLLGGEGSRGQEARSEPAWPESV